MGKPTFNSMELTATLTDGELVGLVRLPYFEADDSAVL